MDQALLSVANLSAFFYSKENSALSQSLYNISFNLHKGETLGIIGESGSGKTITLLSLLGLVDAQPGLCSGEIHYHTGNDTLNALQHIDQAIQIKRDDIGNISEIHKNHKIWDKLIDTEFKKIRGKLVSMVFQNPRLALNPYISIGKQINETIRLHTDIKNKELAKEKAIEWLAAVKMDAPHIRYNNNPYGLSGGMCQRAMIAMALSSESDIIIADEPTSGLDATIQSDILDLLLELKQQYTKSMIIVSHDLSVMKKITDKVIVYYKGHIVESGAAHEVLNNRNKANHPYTNSLLDANSFTNFPEEREKGSVASLQACPFYSHCNHAAEYGNLCKNEKPEQQRISDTHQIACWRYNNV